MLLASFFRVAAAAILILAMPGPARADSGLLIKQYSARYGSLTCMATGKNFRMDASELRVFLRPPFTHMDMYNMSGKTRLSCPINFIGKDIDWRSLSQKEKKAGAKEKIVLRGSESLQQYKLDHYLINLVYPRKPDQPKLDFWTTREKDFPKALESACCTLTGLPSGYGFPIRMYSYEEHTARSGKSFSTHFKILDTTRVTKQEFPDTTFTQPKDFRPVDDLMELMVSSEKTE